MAKGVREVESSDTMIVSGTCTVTGEVYSVAVPLGKFRAWREGELAQDTLAELDMDQREFLISSLTPAEFNQIFEGKEE